MLPDSVLHLVMDACCDLIRKSVSETGSQFSVNDIDVMKLRSFHVFQHAREREWTRYEAQEANKSLLKDVTRCDVLGLFDLFSILDDRAAGVLG